MLIFNLALILVTFRVIIMAYDFFFLDGSMVLLGHLLAESFLLFAFYKAWKKLDLDKSNAL